MLSAGLQMNKQLRRKTKGTEKLPRSVANESRYWNAYLRAHYGRAITISGGASLLMGTLVVVAVAGLVGTEQYDPRFWLGAVGTFVAAGVQIPGGLVMRKRALRDMEDVRDEVDPLRQSGGKFSRRVVPQPSLPAPLVVLGPDGRGDQALHYGLSWSLSY